MMEPNLQTEFEIRPFEYKGPKSFEISELEEPNLDVIQQNITLKLEEGQKRIERHLQTHGISIDEKAIHEQIEEIMGLDEDSLDALQKEVNAKLEQKRRELGKLVKSQ
ncbi:MAG: hypothetical protein V3S13_00605 [Candidatus Omnitrophota bacterium]